MVGGREIEESHEEKLGWRMRILTSFGPRTRERMMVEKPT